MKSRSLHQLLEPGFSEGYDAFKELVDWSGDRSDLTPQQHGWAKLFELLSVAAVEGLNQVETQLEIPPHESVIEFWGAVGSMLATINAQAFAMEGRQIVRREMLSHLKASYDRTINGFAEGGTQ